MPRLTWDQANGVVALRVHGSVAAGGPPLAVMDIAGAQAQFGLLGRLSRIDVRLKPGADREQVLASALRKVEDHYDVILIDCQPSLGLLTVNALTAAHGVIIPLICEFFALRAVALLVDSIEKVQDRLNPKLQIDGVLATMFDSSTLHSREVIARIVDAFGDKVFDTVIKRTVKFPDATVAAEPILAFATNHPGAESYRQLARELISRGGAP